MLVISIESVIPHWRNTFFLICFCLGFFFLKTYNHVYKGTFIVSKWLPVVSKLLQPCAVLRHCNIYLYLWLFEGWQVNYYDLSSRYANILVSISSCFAALAGVITPIVAGEFLSPNVSSCLANWEWCSQLSFCMI